MSPDCPPGDTFSSPGVAAESTEGAGIGGTVAINASGGFFNTSVIVDGKVQALTFAPGYPGGFETTQVLIDFHEFAHDINAVPNDAVGSPMGTAQSPINTQTVLDHCETQIQGVKH
jgi:hypothetical protein